MSLSLPAVVRRLARRQPRKQQARLVTVNGRRFKRATFQDSAQAQRVAASLNRLGPTPHLPDLVMASGPELWVDYLDGHPFRPEDGAALARIYDFYAFLYGQDATTTLPLEATALPRDLERDLWVLHEVGVLDAPARRVLLERAAARRPARVQIGFDYMDARLGNFLWTRDDVAAGIDIENLAAECPLGLGLASAHVYWAATAGPGLGASLEARGLGYLGAALPYLGLCYRAALLKRRALKRRGRLALGDVKAFLEAGPVTGPDA